MRIVPSPAWRAQMGDRGDRAHDVDRPRVQLLAGRELAKDVDWINAAL
jgi:hypothetical protein